MDSVATPMKSRLFDIAITLLQKGFVPIPCEYQGKRPLPGWKWRDAVPTEAQLSILKETLCNLGLRLDKLGVVDIDGPEGADYAMQHFEEAGVIAKTGRGRQWFYRLDEPLPNRIKIAGLPIDFKCGPGSYVIIPPSRHANGSWYEWIKKGELTEFNPTWLPPEGPPANEDSTPTNRYRIRRYMRQIDSIDGQGGDNGAYRAACALIQKFELSFEEAIEEMRIWNAYLESPWPEHRLRYKLNEAIKNRPR